MVEDWAALVISCLIAMFAFRNIVTDAAISEKNKK